MKTYLVTGGAGFIGSNYIYFMLNKYGQDIKIINFDSLTYSGNLENLKGVSDLPNYRFIKGDICNSDELDKVFSENDIDYVIHFAAESHVDRSVLNPSVFLQTNVLGTLNLLNAAKKSWGIGENGEDAYKDGKKYVQISTDEVYGALGETGLFSEKTPINPHSPYSASKASADMLVKAYWDTYKFPINITRCSNNYGAYQFPEKLVPLMICNALNGKPLPVYGDGLQVRDWIYVWDHNKAIDMVTQRGRLGEVYNVGGKNEKTNIYIVNLIIDTLRELLPENDPRRAALNEGLIKHVADRKGHDRRYAIDFTKIHDELGWEPDTMFEDGIKYTIKWYIDNYDWVENVTSGEYQKYYEMNYGYRM